MIMKKIFIILTLFAFTLSMTSCNKDFLDKKPLNAYSETDVFSNDAMCENFVNTMYFVIRIPYNEGTLAACTDEAYFRYGGSSTNYISRGEMDPSKIMYLNEGGSTHNTRNTFINIWNRVYTYVRYMNMFLEKIDNATAISADTKARLKGEVYFLRGWAYGNLLQRIGGFPIVDKTYNIGDDYSIERGNFDECVKFIYADLDKAIELLPDKAATKGRACADAARAMKARVAMFAASPLFNDPTDPTDTPWHGAYSKDKWTTAKNAVYEVIKRAEAGAYSLDDTYDGYWTDVNSPEVIWASYILPTSQNYIYTASFEQCYSFAQLLWAPAATFGGWSSVAPTENMVEEYEMKATGKRPFEDGSGFDPKNPYVGRDPRFYLSILYHGSQFKFNNGTKDSLVTIKIAKGATSAIKNDNFFSNSNGTQGTGYWIRKFLIWGGKVSEGQGDNPNVMYPWFRLAEFYLDYAECAYNLGDDATCRDYINKVRDRKDVMMPHVTESGTALQTRLYHERQIELAFENFRYFDVRRWKIAGVTERKMTYGIRIIKNNAEGTDLTYIMATKGANGEPDFTACQNASLAKLATTSHKDYRDFQPQHYLVPIPQNEITKSGGKLVQNPGY